jgi:hypothetical protein
LALFRRCTDRPNRALHHPIVPYYQTLTNPYQESSTPGRKTFFVGYSHLVMSIRLGASVITAGICRTDIATSSWPRATLQGRDQWAWAKNLTGCIVTRFKPTATSRCRRQEGHESGSWTWRKNLARGADTNLLMRTGPHRPPRHNPDPYPKRCNLRGWLPASPLFSPWLSTAAVLSERYFPGRPSLAVQSCNCHFGAVSSPCSHQSRSPAPGETRRERVHVGNSIPLT